MPLVDDNNILPSIFAPIGQQPLPQPAQEPAAPPILETLGAWMRNGNSVGSALQFNTTRTGVTNDPVPNYNPWKDIVGTPYEGHWQTFVRSNNPDYTAFLKHQIDRETEDRKTIDASSGLVNFIAGAAAVATDPVTYVPIAGEAGAGARTAWVLARGAGIGASAVALQEAALHASQETRTGKESAIAIGGGAVLGGLLGGVVLSRMTPNEVASAERGLVTIATTPVPGSAGAAAVERPTTEALTTSGRIAGAAAKASQWISPVLRLQHSPSPVVREIAGKLYEGSTYLNLHDAGQTLGPSTEILARSKFQARDIQLTQGFDDIYSAMKKAGQNMSHEDFLKEVGVAMTRGDEGVNDFVSQAAKLGRSTMAESYFSEAKAAGIFDEGEEVKFAQSYFPRQYRTKYMVDHEFPLKEQLLPHMEEFIQGKYNAGWSRMQERADKARGELADFNLSPEQRVETVDRLRAEHDQLTQANANEFATLAKIEKLRKEKPQGWRAESKALLAEGGQKLTDLKRQRSVLRSRLYRLEKPSLGTFEERHQKLLTRAEVLQDTNRRAVAKLLDRGQKLEQDIGRNDPAKLKARVSKMRTDFAGLIDRSNRAQDALARAEEKIQERLVKGTAGPQEAQAEHLAKLNATTKAEKSRHERLTALAERLDAAEKLNPEARIAELQKLAREASDIVADKTLSRGERVAALHERAARYSPEQVAARRAQLEAKASGVEAKFAGQWSRHQDVGGTGFKELARDVLDSFFNKVLHRNFGDQSSVMPDYITPLERGPIRERTLPIPDKVLHDLGMLEQNALEVLRRYGRTVGADIELTKKFGSPTMVDQRTAVEQAYEELRQQVPDKPKELRALNARMHQDVRDLEAGRDLLRGTYRAKENMSEYGRTVRAAMHMQFVLKMGGASISSLGELIRPAMVHGLGTYMNEGLGAAAKNLSAFRAAAKEGELAGAVGERILNQKLLGMAGVMDNYAKGNALERFIENMASAANKWSGLGTLTDFQKNMGSVLTQHKILDGVVNGKNTRLLRYLGIDEDVGTRIAQQFEAHGETIDGVKVAHTEAWTDPLAVDHYRAAIFKDVNSQVTTPGIGDLPLWMRTPTGRLIGQFKSFNIASHQKVLLRGLQESKANFVSGLIGLSTIGMAVAALKAWRGGEERWQRFVNSSKNPGYLIAEGLDSSGIFSLPFDAANTVENLTPNAGFTFNPIKSPIELAGYAATGQGNPQAQSMRFAYRSPLATLLGPTAGTTEDVFHAAAGITNLAQGEDVKSAQRRAAEKLLPYNSYFPVRELMQLGEDTSPYADW